MNHTRKIIRHMPESGDVVKEYGWDKSDRCGPIEVRTRSDYVMIVWYIEENGYSMSEEDLDSIQFEEDASMNDPDSQASTCQWNWSQEGVTSDI